MKYKMIAADFDFTLGIAPDIIEESTLRAVKEYIKRGGKFVIVSGRMLKSVLKICKKYDITGDIICYQGAVIASAPSGKMELSGGLSYTQAAEITDELIKDGHYVIADVGEDLFYNVYNDYIKLYEKSTVVNGKLIKDLKTFILSEKKDVRKVMVMCSEEDKEANIKLFRKKFGDGVLINSGGPYLIEIVNPNLTKGEAVKYLAKKYGIDIKDVMTVGDSTNDITLMQIGAFGVATGDGKEELKSAADEITVPFKEKPVEYLIKKYCL